MRIKHFLLVCIECDILQLESIGYTYFDAVQRKNRCSFAGYFKELEIHHSDCFGLFSKLFYSFCMYATKQGSKQR